MECGDFAPLKLTLEAKQEKVERSLKRGSLEEWRVGKYAAN